MSLPAATSFAYYLRFNEFRLTDSFCDVVIRVQDRTFPCHRVILASAMEYFRVMFQNFREAHQKQEIELQGVNASDFELLLTHIYGGVVSVNDNNIYRLLKMSHYLSVGRMEDLCIRYLLKNDLKSFPIKIIVQLFYYACQTEKTQALKDKLTKVLAENFIDASKEPKFHRVPGRELLEILYHEKLQKDSNAMVDFLVNWLKAQSDVNDDRKAFLSELLDEHNFGIPPKVWLAKALDLISELNRRISSGVMQNIREERVDTEHGPSECNNELAGVNTHCLPIYMDIDECGIYSSGAAIEEDGLPFLFYTADSYTGNQQINSSVLYHLNMYKFRSKLLYPELQFIRNYKYMENSLVYCKSVFVDKTNFLMTMTTSTHPGISEYKLTYEPSVLHEKGVHDLKSYISNYSSNYCMNVTSCDTCIYLYNRGEFLVFNCETNAWCRMSTNGLLETGYPDLLSCGKSLYMTGGKKLKWKTNRLINEEVVNGKFFQHYDRREGRWKELPSLTYSHSRHASCIYNDELYVTGGEDLSYFTGHIECFDFRAHKWRVFETSLPQRKVNHVVIGHDRKLWFFGGQKYNTTSGSLYFTNDLTWCFYDIEEHTWSDVSSMPLSYGAYKTKIIHDVVKKI